MTDKIIGRYRVLEKIGQGGMGEVFRAKDVALGREVALKFLPAEFSRDPARLVRFEREAQLLASLNHPHIAQIYGLERDEGRPFLALEMVEGPTLAEQLAAGPIALEESLRIALQIVQALESAHDKGIIHRDLKPSNIKLSPEGAVKVLDFGIAKALDPDAITVETTGFPTLADPMTAAGLVLGTSAYMSPEQARGQVVDKRTDIWAFGVLLWEMVTGSRLFGSELVSDVVAAVLRDQPPRSELPANTPPSLHRLLHRCLEKEPANRLHDLADARLDLEEAMSELAAGVTTAEREAVSRRRSFRWAVAPAFLVGALLAGLVSKMIWDRSPPHTSPRRFSVNLPTDFGLWASQHGDQTLALSPDGRWLVYWASKGNEERLFKRSLERFESTAISEVNGAYHPFFSPDSQWLGYFRQQDSLHRVSIAGGPAQTLTDLEAPPWGATWGPNGLLVFDLYLKGLWQVSEMGGEPRLLIEPAAERGEWALLWPQFLPDGDAVLFTGFRGLTADEAHIGVVELATGGAKIVLDHASFARYLPTGHLVFGRRGGVYIAPFDLAKREVTGTAVPVPEPIFYEPSYGIPHFAFSNDGTLAYVPATTGPDRRLVSVDLEGKAQPLFEKARGFMYPRYSPDGQRLAITISGPDGSDVLILNPSTGTQSKLTNEGSNMFPVWTPDGTRVAFYSYRKEAHGIYWKPADGSGPAKKIVVSTEPTEIPMPYSFTPDGKRLVYGRYSPKIDLWIANVDGDWQPEPLVAGEVGACCAAVSPDGNWLAYTASETGLGTLEVFVQPMAGGPRHQLSADGGLNPIWSPDQRTVYYSSDNRMMAVDVSASKTSASGSFQSGSFQSGAARVLFEARFAAADYSRHPNFDVAPKGKSLVMIEEDQNWGYTTELNIVLDWFEQIKNLAATNG